MLRKLFASPHRRSVPRPFRKPTLEALEDRLAPAVYSLTDLGKLSIGSSHEVINSVGQVVGTSSDSSGSSQAVLYNNGQLTNLGTLPGTNSSFAGGINNSGQIVGAATATNGSLAEAFLYSNGQMTDLNSLVSSGSSGQLNAAVAINASGEIAGVGEPTPGSDTQAFLYSNGTVTYLGSFGSTTHSSVATDINASGQVVGYSQTSGSSAGNGQFHAFLYSNGQLIDLGTLAGNSSMSSSFAYAINDSGQVVGYSLYGAFDDAFLYSNGTMKDLGMPAGFDQSDAVGINASGQIVGYASATSGGREHAFLYSNGTWTDLNSLLPAGTTVTLDFAFGINDNGQIVAEGSDDHAYLLTPQQTTGTVISEGTVSPNALTVSNSGQQVTVSATVNTNGSPAATGNVVFSLVGPKGTVVSDGPTGVAIGSNGQASDTLTLPSGAVAGAYTLQVAYTNNNQTTTQAFTGALNISSIPVNIALSGVTPTKLAASANVQDVTATATVTPASGSGVVNEGIVTFTLLDGTTPVAHSVQVQVVNGTAQLTNSNPLVVPANTPAGNYTLQATYFDDASQFASSQPATAQLTITSTSSPTPTPTPTIQAQVQQGLVDTLSLAASMLSGSPSTFFQVLQDYQSLSPAARQEVLHSLDSDLFQMLMSGLGQDNRPMVDALFVVDGLLSDNPFLIVAGWLDAQSESS